MADTRASGEMWSPIGRWSSIGRETRELGGGFAMASEFGTVLRRIRRSKDVTQAGLAEVIGRPQCYLSDLETGRVRPPAPETIRAMAIAMEAEDELPELLRLAAISAGKFVIRLTPGLDREVANVLVDIGRACNEGSLDVQTARRLRKAIAPDPRHRAAV
jgi:transcriptional regulator with XRE-family HTH domain